MKSNYNLFFSGLTLFFISDFATGSPFFYNASKAFFGLAGSASAYASAPAASSAIIDLTKREEKTARLQNDKYLNQQEQFSIEEGVNGRQVGENSGDGGEEDKNEASPNLLQKKISKILAKLQLIAQIKNAYHYNPEVHDHETNITLTSQENQNTTQSSVNITFEDPVQKEIIETKFDMDSKQNLKYENIQQILPNLNGAKQLSSDEPTKINLDLTDTRKTINEATTNQQKSANDEFRLIRILNRPVKEVHEPIEISNKVEHLEAKRNEKLKENRPGRLGMIGVFLAELVGSLVGLSYGAVAQITSGGQSPVTVSVSEAI